MEEMDKVKFKEKAEEALQTLKQMKKDLETGQVDGAKSIEIQILRGTIKTLDVAFDIMLDDLKIKEMTDEEEIKKQDEMMDKKIENYYKEIDEFHLELKNKFGYDIYDISKYVKKAEEGEPEAQYALYNKYCIRREHDEAKKWLLKSAENGYPEAMIDLAISYKNGQYDFGKDREKAIEWFEKASKTDDREIAKEALEILQQLNKES